MVITRRHFMATSAFAGAALVSGCSVRLRSRWEFLSEDAAATLAAICDQIIPADDFPSASQAGVLGYIDRQLTRHYRRHRQSYLEGLRQADEISGGLCGLAIAKASPSQQLQAVIELERQNRQFFDLVRSHSMEGFYGSPRHGGNRDAVSWRMLGIDEPPVRGRAQYGLSRDSKS